jgi:uncharacterized protein (TIGR03790 family)
MLGAAISLSAQPQRESYDDVMLVINERSWASREIGAFFATRRGIPERNIYRMNIDTAESIDSSRFLLVKWQMQQWMRQNDLVDSINYIVTTKGCPLRVRTSQWDRFDSLGQLTALGGQASFEDCIALMNGEDSTLALAVKFAFPINRYYDAKVHFKHDPVRRPIYLVTRLDAYTVDQVKGYITRAETPAILGEGLWVLDVDPGKDGNPGYKVGNDWLRGADQILRSRGMDVLINSDTAYVRNNTSVVGYASWGSNDGHSGGRDGAIPHNTWLNASIAETFVSTGGRTFNAGTTGGQSLIADWVAEGACGVKGYTDEPYLSAIAHPDILFDRYTAGYNMAESFWAASIFSAWRQVVIGDPKMRLGSMLALSTSQLDFGSSVRGVLVRDTISVRNNLSVPLMINSLSLAGANPTSFSASIPGRTIPASIAAGDSFDIVVVLDPLEYGSIAADLVIAHRRAGDARDFTLLAQLTGTIARPALTSPGSHDFGAVAIGETAEYDLALGSSIETDTLFINNFSKSGAGAPRFTVTPSTSLPTGIVGGATLGLHVAYTPSGQTRDSATLTVYTLNGGVPLRLKLYGTGALSAAPELASASSLGISTSPNPATLRSELRFALDRPAHVRVEILDLLGRTVRRVADAAMPAGEQRVSLDLADLASGSYLCRVESTGSDGIAHTEVTRLVRQ